ncbi:MAG: ABC transporter substrate-binding protein [Oscillospiraceae bacterium]|nr:ABC transporter substrate-binding protein [Oscillospiraceae bacterium]
MKSKLLTAALLSLCTLLLLAGCSQPSGEQAPEAQPLPDLVIGYTFSNHHEPILVAASMGDAFADRGVYLREVIERERYILIVDGNERANIELVVAGTGGEVVTMMEMGHVNMGFKSIGLPMSSIDQGASMRVLGPVHVDGFGLIASHEVPAENFDEFVAFVQAQELPVRIGHHQPNNSAVILFMESCRLLGLSVTEDPTDLTADILMVNMRGLANLIPAIDSGEVDAWIGPSPFPEMAVLNDVGNLIIDLKDLPPGGRWTDFPCCVFSATNATLDEHREIVEYLYKLLTISAEFANGNRDVAGRISADWTGVLEEAAINTMTVFSTDVTQSWLDHAALTLSVLQADGTISGAFEGRDLSEIMDELFDLSVFENARNR